MKKLRCKKDAKFWKQKICSEKGLNETKLFFLLYVNAFPGVLVYIHQYGLLQQPAEI